jgi:hypothetical protein
MNKPMAFQVPTGTRRWDSTVMKLNVETDVIHRNIRRNIQRQLPQHAPHEETAQPIALVGGGWSASEPAVFEELRMMMFDCVGGAPRTKLIALNGSASWLLERNLRPSMHIVMDARPENLPFVEKPIPGCVYYLASQCDPSLFEACEGRDVRIFHVISSEAEEERKILDEFYNKRWIQVPGAGTVGIVAILLMRSLGFKFQHLFGIDSCYAPDGRHHSFPQPLNDGEGSAIFWCAGKSFRCSAWQASQAQNFISVVQHHGKLLQLEVHGDGLLAHMLKYGASLEEEPASEIPPTKES